MGKEYPRRHGRKRKRKKRKSKKKSGARPRRAAAPFRRRRRFAGTARRAPAAVLHERTSQAMMIELARQLLGPRYPGPNKITQQGPPFLPYDPWAEQRRSIQRQEEQKLEQMTRIARERARDEPPAFPDDED